MTRTKRIYLALIAVLLSPMAANGTVIEHITNGDFETGTFAGWTTTNTGSSFLPQINDGTAAPSGSTAQQVPIGGSFDALFDQTGPGSAALFQQIIVLPTSGIINAIVSWDDRIVSEGVQFRAGEQQFQVVIRDLTSVILSTLFITNPGDPISQLGPNVRSFDITALAQLYAGQSVSLNFETIVNDFFMPVWVDNVSFQTTAVPEPGTLALLGIGLFGMGLARRKKI